MRPLISFLCTGLLLLAGCNCPPDEQVGNLALSTEALDFLPYTGAETLTFRAEDGSEIRFSAPRSEEINNDRLCIRTICTEAKFGSPSSCDYYAAESRRYSYFSEDNDAVLDLVLYSELYNYNTTDFYDLCLVSLSYGEPAMEASHIIVPRFTGGFDPDDTDIVDQMEERANVTLQDSTFTNVLTREEGDLAVYLQPGQGVIGFKGGGKTWVRRP